MICLLQASKVGAALIMAALFNACVPVSYYAVVSPALTGKVHRDGKPIENAVVSLEVPRGDTCSFTSEVSTRTDRDGVFRFEAQKEFELLGSVGGISRFQVCIVDGYARHQGWYERRSRGLDEKLILDCNVQNPIPVFQDTPTGKTMGICLAKRSF